jgi:phosphate starvation-inducible protein PhoH and related proteins
VARVSASFQDFEALRRQGVNPHNGELNGMLRLVVADPATTLRSLADSGKQRSAGVKRTVQPRSINQRKYVEAIEQNDMVFGVGPAGTGKTYLAVAMAVAAMNAKKVSRIVLVRPAVEAGERLGFLPGSLQEKVDPYLRPLYDALYDLLEPEKVDKMLEKNVIEVAPLAFMRGRTLNDAFIIMDEAQNTTIEQMKMFLTRMGNNSKAVITGDITQIDLPNPRKSGLVDAINVLDGVEGIHFCHFEDSDVVRHALVQRIVRAYESAKPQQQELPLGRVTRLDFTCVIIGENQSLSSGGGFADNPSGDWTAMKIFLPTGDDNAEVFLNFNAKTGKAQFSQKDPDYGDPVLAKLATVL